MSTASNGFYRCKKGKATKLSTNFTSTEFDCKGSGCCSETLVDEGLVDILQKIRDHFGKPLTINSAYRCTKHNAAVGGASSSRHVKGMAADISVRDTQPKEVAKYAESIGVLGIGLYETAKDGYFVHVDTRTSKAFWYGQAQAARSTFGGKAAQVTESTSANNTSNKSTYTLKDFVLEVQEIVGAKKDGIAGAETLSKTITISAKTNRTHALVKPIQKRLAAMGYAEVGTADGIAGSNFTKAVKRMQKDRKSVQDGELTAGKTSWKVLLGLLK